VTIKKSPALRQYIDAAFDAIGKMVKVRDLPPQ
jgi:hypothetical protein